MSIINNEEENDVSEQDKIQENIHETKQMAESATKLAASIAAKDVKGVVKEAFNLLKNKKFRRRLIFNALAPILSIIFVMFMLYSIFNSILGEVIDLIFNKATQIKGFIQEAITWLTDDYWIKLDEKVEYVVDPTTGKTLGIASNMTDDEISSLNGVKEKFTVIEKYIKDLNDLGISLKELKILGNFDIAEEDENLTEKELVLKILTEDKYKKQKELIEKYISEFIRADIITQQIHMRRGEELVKSDNENHIDGGVYLYRTKQATDMSGALKVEEDEYIKQIGDKEYVQMTYAKPEEWEELKNKKSNKIRYRYTINENGELIIAKVKTIEKIQGDISNPVGEWFTDVQEWINDKLGIGADSTEVIIEEEKPIDYKEFISEYSMPFEFLINLCEITQNPEFVYHVALLARETKIVLAVHDDTTVEKVAIEEENKYQKYENHDDEYTSGATTVGDPEVRKRREVTITTVSSPKLNILYANTWTWYKENEYIKDTKITTTTNGPFTESKPLPDKLGIYHPEIVQSYWVETKQYERTIPEWWEDEFCIETTTKTETTTTQVVYSEPIEKNAVEKSKQFLGLLRNADGKCYCDDCYENKKDAIKCAKEAVFDREGINVSYRIPNVTREEMPLNKLISGEKWLYELLGEDMEGNDNLSPEEDYNSLYKTKLNGLLDHMKYLMSFPENEEFEILDDGTIVIPDDEEEDTQDIEDIEEIIVKIDEPNAARPVTKAELILAIDKTFSGKSKENALSIVDTLIECQNNYKVNAIFVLAFAYQETHIGVIGDYIDDNNWLSWNLGQQYSSPQENVETVMRRIAAGDGLYFAQGLITIEDIGYRFCPNLPKYPTQGDTWVKNVTAKVKQMYANIGEKQTGSDGVDTYTTFKGVTYINYKQDSGASWSDNEFAGGTMQSSGCSITSIAIVLTGYGQDVTPEDIRSEVGGKETNLSIILNNHGIKHTRPGRVLTENEVISYLQSGRPVIVNVGAIRDTFWTKKGHYMVLLDYMEENGVKKVYVSNPGTVNTAKNGWVELNKIMINLKTGSILIDDYPPGVTEKNVLKHSFSQDKVTVKIPGLSSKKKIAWVSDVHIVADYPNKGSDVTSSQTDIQTRYNMMVTDDKKVYSADLWEQIIEYINNNNFDAVIFGGDIIDYYSDNNFKVLLEGYNKLNSNIKRMYIRGSKDDHDVWTGRTSYDTSYAQGKYSSIDNNSDSKYIDLDGVRIVGLNWSADKNVNPSVAQSLINSASGSVVLATHVPFASKTNASGLESWCKGIHNNQVYYWADNSYKWVIRK